MIKQFFKKVLISYLIIICCIFTPTYNAYAASAGGWAFSSFDAVASVVTAVKNGSSATATVAKSPITAKIAKGIAGGVIAGAAIPLAISQLTGIALDAVDWVFDPENNAVKFKPKGGAYKVDSITAPTAQQACEKYIKTVGGFGKVRSVVAKPDQVCFVYSDKYPDGIGAAIWSLETNDNWSYTPIPTVADKIYDNAKTDSSSRSVVNDAVRDYVNEGSADVALDNAKADADANHACGTGTHWSGSACVADTPTTPDTPDTPFDPSSIIDAINSVFDAVMSLPDVINNALDSLLVDIKDFFQPVIDLVTDFIDWFKDTATAWKDDFVDEYKAFRDWVKTEPMPVQAEPVDIQTTDMPQMESTDITFGGQCPQNFDIDIDFFGKPVKFTLFDSSVFCQFLSDWIRIPVIFSASLVAVYILGGRRSD